MRQNSIVSNIAIQNTGETSLLFILCILIFPFNIHYELHLSLHIRRQSGPIVLQSLNQSVMVNQELSSWKKYSVLCHTVYVPILTSGHKMWVVAERLMSQIQVLKRLELLLLLRIERSQLSQFGWLPLELYKAHSIGQKPWHSHMTLLERLYLPVGLELSEDPQDGLESVLGGKEVWMSVYCHFLEK